jgi:predicted transcriptional regulator
MGARQTSIDCYRQIQAQGLLSKQRFEVYQALLYMGKPSTTREVYATMDVAKQEATRFTELRNIGVIYEVRNRKCTITGRTAIEWDLTDGLPKDKIISNNSKKQRLDTCIDALKELYKKKNTSSIEDWQVVANLIRKI